MIFIDVRCQSCERLICQISKNSYGIVRLNCRRCGKENTVSLATIIKHLDGKSATIASPTQERTRA